MIRLIASQLLTWVCLISLVHAQSDDPKAATAEAPAGYGILEHFTTGVVYVDNTLLERFRELEDQSTRLRKQILDGVPSAQTAKDKLQELAVELTVLRELIEENKILVEPYRSFSRTDKQEFALSDSGRIIITADNVRVKGWDGQNITCIVEKTILGDQQPDLKELDAIKVVHEIRVAEDWVGMTDDDRDAGEKKFLQSESGKDLSAESLKVRAKLVADIHNSYSMYKDFQGKQVNTIGIEGLTFQQGNQHIAGSTRSPGGASTSGSHWKRSAKVTVLVPACKHVAIRGCQETIFVNDLQADLLLTNHDSHNREYGGSFVIDNVQGNVVVHQAPIRSITNVSGNVQVLQTDEFCNRSTSHNSGFRTMISAETGHTVLDQISGDVTARILRTNLELRNLSGAVDVENEHGDTRWFVDREVKDTSHRILSSSGGLEFITPRAKAAGIPIYAYTQAGIARTSFTREQFEDRSFSTAGRGWYGFNTQGASKDLFSAYQRHAQALKNSDRSSGIDLISHGGSVMIDRRASDD